MVENGNGGPVQKSDNGRRCNDGTSQGRLLRAFGSFGCHYSGTPVALQGCKE